MLSARVFDWLTSAIYNEALISAVRSLVEPRPGLKLLDVPCGTGSLLDLARPCDYYGVDLSRERIAHASESSVGRRFMVGNAECLPFRGAAFDRVLVSGLFHHVEDAVAERISAELARVLRPQGHMVVLEAIWPRRWYNVTGTIARMIDDGQHVRWPDEYFRLWQPRFESTVVRYPKRLSLEDLLVRLRAR